MIEEIVKLNAPLTGTYGMSQENKTYKVDDRARLNIPDDLVKILLSRQNRDKKEDLLLYLSSQEAEGIHYLVITDSTDIINSDLNNFYLFPLEYRGRATEKKRIATLLEKSGFNKGDEIIYIGCGNHIKVYNKKHKEIIEKV